MAFLFAEIYTRRCFNIKRLISFATAFVLALTVCLSFVTTAQAASAISLSSDQQWITGLSSNMEYITKTTYLEQGASGANNTNWTKLSGGSRPDGTNYSAFALVNSSQLAVASAWYGETVFFRTQGTVGIGTAVDIPAYSDLDVQYKSAVRILTIYATDVSQSLYATYITAMSNSAGYLTGTADSINVSITKASIVSFNKVPNSYLTDAEGNYIYDLVAIDGYAGEDPDISGAAAWALKDYIDQGYGFLAGHDVVYGSGGVYSGYVPDSNDITTSTSLGSYDYNSHWNANWLVGVNERYTSASPYDAALRVLALNDAQDRSTLYGNYYDGIDLNTKNDSVLRISAVTSGTDIDARSPTNYPYDSSAFDLGNEFVAGGTHTNQQLAYGKVWVEFSPSYAEGTLVEDVNSGLYGTNNFYLTTNGNIGMIQTGHFASNISTVRSEECKILINTILYLSQREPCAICGSGQCGNETVHTVTRIRSVEELAFIGNPAYANTYPLDGCYTLVADIELPSDWVSIENFSGHFNADGCSITINGVSLFAQDGTVGQNTDGWNLGSNANIGNPSISNGEETTTAVARVIGSLNELFGTSTSIDYSNYTVTVIGSDGKTYSSTTNREGKYVLSNLPVNESEMTATVYTASGAKVTQYGEIYAQIPTDYWESNQTVSLSIVGDTARPIQNQTIYEDSDVVLTATMTGDSIADRVQWYYRGGPYAEWSLVSTCPYFEVETGKLTFVDGETSYSQSTLTINSLAYEFNLFQFKAVFTKDGVTYDTFDAKTGDDDAGTISVHMRPVELGAIENQTVWQGESVSFTASIKYYRSIGDGLTVRWQYRGDENCAWESIDDASIVTGNTVITGATVTNVVRETGDEISPYLSFTTLTLSEVSPEWAGYQFRAVFDYPEKSRMFTSDEVSREGNEGELSVLIKTVYCIEQPSNIVETTSADNLVGSYPYNAAFEFISLSADCNVSWEFKTNSSATYQPISAFPYTYNVTVGNVQETDTNTYQVSTSLTLINPPSALDDGDNHYYFRAVFDNGTVLYSNSGDITMNYKVDVKPGEAVGISNATGSSSVYTYPSLTVFSPAGVRYFRVSFDAASVSTAANSMNATTTIAGVTVIETNKGYEYNSSTALTEAQVQAFFRAIEITVGTSEVTIEWFVSSERQDASYDAYSGKYYEYVASKGITWTQSYAAASSSYNNVLQASGQLATVTSQTQQNFVQSLLNGKVAWIGLTNNSTYNGGTSAYRWIDKTTVSYTNYASSPSSSSTLYARINASGKWEAVNNTNNTNVTVTDLNNYNGWWAGGWTCYFGKVHSYNLESTNNNNGYAGLDLLAPDSNGGSDTGIGQALSLVNGHQYWVYFTIGEYGDSNGNMVLSLNAFNATFNSYWYSGNVTKSLTYTYNSSNVAAVMAMTNGNGPNYTGVRGQLYHLEIVDLTVAFTDKGLAIPSTTWLTENIGVFNGSKTVTVTGTQSDADGYLIEYVVDDNAPSHTDTSAHVTATLGGSTSDPLPPATVQVTEYRTDTTVIFSCEITALKDISPDSDAEVVFTVTDQTGVQHELVFEDIVLPAGKSTRAYVEYDISDVVGSITVRIESSDNLYTDIYQISGTVTAIDTGQTPPDPTYVDTAQTFTSSSPPSTSDTTVHTWLTYTAQKINGVWQYTEYENIASLNSVLQIQPDAQVPTTDSSVLKSGYGISQTVTASYTSSDLITAPQTMVAYYPEFHYTGYWRVLELRADTGTQSIFSLAENPYSLTDARVHFTPLWYPDGTYTAYVTIRDCWTPVGELSQSVTDGIAISGTIYDDWYVAKT